MPNVGERSPDHRSARPARSPSKRPTMNHSLLPSQRAVEPWLVEELRMREAVGFIGGEPKCGRSFRAPHRGRRDVLCQRRFPTWQTEPVPPQTTRP